MFVLSFKIYQSQILVILCFHLVPGSWGVFPLLLLSCSEMGGQVPAEHSFIASNGMCKSTGKSLCYSGVSSINCQEVLRKTLLKGGIE